MRRIALLSQPFVEERVQQFSSDGSFSQASQFSLNDLQHIGFGHSEPLVACCSSSCVIVR